MKKLFEKKEVLTSYQCQKPWNRILRIISKWRAPFSSELGHLYLADCSLTFFLMHTAQAASTFFKSSVWHEKVRD